MVFFLPHERLGELLASLIALDYEVLAQQSAQGALQYLPLLDVADLPRGLEVNEAPGYYRLVQATHGRFFAWATGPQGIKPHVFSSREPLWRARATADGFEVETVLPQQQRRAILGVRACDLAALQLQDQHFLGNRSDPYYAARREELLLIAINCTHPASTCFCASTGDGPAASFGFDVQMTELDNGFVLSSATSAGERVLQPLALAAATPAQLAQAEQLVSRAASSQTRCLPAAEHFSGKLEHPLWQQLGEQCLGCGNCTQVCPSCFCHAETDVATVTGELSTHERVWDSCFSDGHAWLHGFQVRPELAQRYRQWFMHKLFYWHEQYGRSGCVGCGRCIVWCPVGIDLVDVAGRLTSV